MNAWQALDTRAKQNLEARARRVQGLLARFRGLRDWPAAPRYAATALLVAVTFLFCLTLEGVSNYPLFAFMLPIITASFLFGRRAGYFATVLSAVLALEFLIPLGPRLAPGKPDTIVTVAVFIFVGLFMAYAIEAMRVTIDVLVENADLREEKRGLEKELFHAQKMEAVGRANSILAHDFKNVLTPVMSAVYVLRERLAPDDEIAELLDVLDTACHHGARLAEDIRSFGRKEQADCMPVDLNSALQEALPVFRRTLRRNVSLQLTPGEDLPEASLDPSLLERALANLIDNAADAISGHGTITIRTSLERLPETGFCGFGRCAPGDYLCLAVTDTGCGMSPDVQARMFEPFFTTKPCGRGTGLGMAMVADFVRHAQGCVAVDSRPGAGTTIRLFLPPAAPVAVGRTPRQREMARPAGIESRA